MLSYFKRSLFNCLVGRNVCSFMLPMITDENLTNYMLLHKKQNNKLLKQIKKNSKQQIFITPKEELEPKKLLL